MSIVSREGTGAVCPQRHTGGEECDASSPTLPTVDSVESLTEDNYEGEDTSSSYNVR